MSEDKVVDPVCGMEMKKEDATTSTSYDGEVYYFCAFQCKEEFDRSPASFARKVA